MSRSSSCRLSITAAVVVLIMSTAVWAQPLAFRWRTDVSVPQAPRAIAAADLNGDGWQDLVLAGTGPGTVSVLTSTGIEDGDAGQRFVGPRNIIVGGGPFELAIGDLNRDGRPDVVVANADANSINLLFGIGRGEFAPQVDHHRGTQRRRRGIRRGAARRNRRAAPHACGGRDARGDAGRGRRRSTAGSTRMTLR